MKKYRVDLVSRVSVIVEASSEDKAIELAEDFATNDPKCFHSFEFEGYDDSLVEVDDSRKAEVSENDFLND